MATSAKAKIHAAKWISNLDARATSSRISQSKLGDALHSSAKLSDFTCPMHPRVSGYHSRYRWS